MASDLGRRASQAELATSFKTDSRLAEVSRDLQVVGQAATLAPEWYPIGGRAFLGLDPGPRLR